MNLTVIEYGGFKQKFECESFEFRTNQVSNWIRIKFANGSSETIANVSVIKSNESEEKSCETCTHGKEPKCYMEQYINGIDCPNWVKAELDAHAIKSALESGTNTVIASGKM